MFAQYVGRVLVDLEQCEDRWLGCVLRPSAVVGEHDAIDAVFESCDCVFDALDAFDDEGEGGDGAQPVYDLPVDAGVDKAGVCFGYAGALGGFDYLFDLFFDLVDCC